MHRKVMHSPIGRLMLGEEDGALVRVAFEREIPAGIEEQAEELPLQAKEVLEKAQRQLEEYCSSYADALERVIDRFDNYLEIPEQLAWGCAMLPRSPSGH